MEGGEERAVVGLARWLMEGRVMGRQLSKSDMPAATNATPSKRQPRERSSDAAGCVADALDDHMIWLFLPGDAW